MTEEGPFLTASLPKLSPKVTMKGAEGVIWHMLGRMYDRRQRQKHGPESFEQSGEHRMKRSHGAWRREGGSWE